MNKCSNQILLHMHDVVHASCTHINTEGGAIRDFAKWWIGSKMTSLKVMNITNPSYFISTFVTKIIAIISTLQIAQATSSPKSKVEIVLDVSRLNLTPWMTIMFSVHSLHFLKVIDGTNDRGSSNKTPPLNVVGMQQTFSMRNLS